MESLQADLVYGYYSTLEQDAKEAEDFDIKEFIESVDWEMVHEAAKASEEAIRSKMKELARASNKGLESFLLKVSCYHKVDKIDTIYYQGLTEKQYQFYSEDKLVATLDEKQILDRHTFELKTEFLGDIRGYGDM